jgi:hypothetical protein
MLPRENHLFGGTGPKPSQDSVPADLTLAGDFGFCFHCEVGSSLVLRRPIEITSFIIHNLGWQARSRFLSRLSEMPQLAQVNSPR